MPNSTWRPPRSATLLQLVAVAPRFLRACAAPAAAAAFLHAEAAGGEPPETEPGSNGASSSRSIPSRGPELTSSYARRVLVEARPQRDPRPPRRRVCRPHARLDGPRPRQPAGCVIIPSLGEHCRMNQRRRRADPHPPRPQYSQPPARRRSAATPPRSSSCSSAAVTGSWSSSSCPTSSSTSLCVRLSSPSLSSCTSTRALAHL